MPNCKGQKKNGDTAFNLLKAVIECLFPYLTDIDSWVWLNGQTVSCCGKTLKRSAFFSKVGYTLVGFTDRVTGKFGVKIVDPANAVEDANVNVEYKADNCILGLVPTVPIINGTVPTGEAQFLLCFKDTLNRFVPFHVVRVNILAVHKDPLRFELSLVRIFELSDDVDAVFMAMKNAVPVRTSKKAAAKRAREQENVKEPPAPAPAPAPANDDEEDVQVVDPYDESDEFYEPSPKRVEAAAVDGVPPMATAAPAPAPAPAELVNRDEVVQVPETVDPVPLEPEEPPAAVAAADDTAVVAAPAADEQEEHFYPVMDQQGNDLVDGLGFGLGLDNCFTLDPTFDPNADPMYDPSFFSH